jgi:hypothetical protein
MIRLLKKIMAVLLASCYLVASFGTLVFKVAMPRVSTGYEKVASAKSSPREHSKQVWTQRRHMPMVKGVWATPLLPADTRVHHDHEHASAVRSADPLFLACEFYFSSLSDRAPPLS